MLVSWSSQRKVLGAISTNVIGAHTMGFDAPGLGPLGGLHGDEGVVLWRRPKIVTAVSDFRV
jgi:hypothetical protein